MYISNATSEKLPPVPAMSWDDATGASLREKQLQPHEALFCEGDDAAFLYEVVGGVMCNYRILSDGRRQVTSFAYPGDLIGLGDATNCRFNCDAIDDACVRCIPMGAIMRSAHENGDVGRRLLEIVSTELARMHEHQLLLGRKFAIEKLSSFLLMLLRRNGKDHAEGRRFRLPMSRRDIADFLAMTIETVSRNMSRLKDMGVIELSQSETVIVRDTVKLEELAEGENS